MYYEVFISYYPKDTDIVDRVYRTCDKSGISYFVDR